MIESIEKAKEGHHVFFGSEIIYVDPDEQELPIMHINKSDLTDKIESLNKQIEKFWEIT